MQTKPVSPWNKIKHIYYAYQSCFPQDFHIPNFRPDLRNNRERRDRHVPVTIQQICRNAKFLSSYCSWGTVCKIRVTSSWLKVVIGKNWRMETRANNLPRVSNKYVTFQNWLPLVHFPPTWNQFALTCWDTNPQKTFDTSSFRKKQDVFRLRNFDSCNKFNPSAR